MKAWLKGGLWGIGVSAILLLLTFVSRVPCEGGNCGTALSDIASTILLFISYPLLFLKFNFIIASIISFFIIGSIIGLIVGKVRNKNKGGKKR